VNKIAKKKKIIDDDNIYSEKEDKEQRKPKKITDREKIGHVEREVIILDNQLDKKVEKVELDDMDDIDVEKKLVTINEDSNKLPEFNCMYTFSFCWYSYHY
jgi:hypothetical protein